MIVILLGEGWLLPSVLDFWKPPVGALDTQIGTVDLFDGVGVLVPFLIFAADMVLGREKYTHLSHSSQPIQLLSSSSLKAQLS